MAIQNSYKVNGEINKPIEGDTVDIDLSIGQGAKSGCLQRPIPCLNKITVTSRDGENLSSSKTIYAGYKIVEQMVGNLVPAGNYNPNTPNLNTIITSGKFGIFEPAHYNSELEAWVNYALSDDKVKSLINVGTSIKICVKIEYTKSDGTSGLAYVNIPGAANNFHKEEDKEVPYYDEIDSRPDLLPWESVDERLVDGPTRRTLFECILSDNDLNIVLSSHIVDPKTTDDITVTLMAYIGTTPTANNTFPIHPISTQSKTSIVVQFDTYEPTIDIYNKDTTNNQDSYHDDYGFVAEYNTETTDDTSITIRIIPPGA